MPTRAIDGPQGRLNLSESSDGGGIPILFVHSDGGTLHHWDGIRRAMTGRPTAAMDRRGHGRSDPPRSGSHAHRDAARDISAVADALGYERMILVGHSGGACTAYAFASLEPDRLLGLLLVDPPPDPAILPPGMIEETLERLQGEDYQRTVEDYFRVIAGDNPAVAQRVLTDIRSTPRETIVGAFEAMSRFRPGEYTGYEGPALSIIQPQFDVDGALHRIARMEHIAIGNGGHWIHLGAPDAFLEALEDFIARIELPAPDPDGVTAIAERRSGV